jgi:hypothetical protein
MAGAVNRPSCVTQRVIPGTIGCELALGFVWLMLALKIPLAMLIYIVWWAIRQEPETPSSDDDGGIRRERPHPPKPFPRRPRRGPHGDPAPASPARVRTVRARARMLEH